MNMQVRHEASGLFVVSLKRGDDLRAKVEEFTERENIFGASVSAIGAVENPELGFYKLEQKDYIRQVFEGSWELVSLLGNISLKDGKPFLHAHVSISGNDFNVVGGHFFDARVAVVVEMFIKRTGTLRRVPCEDIGVHCWDLNVDKFSF